MWVLRLVQKNFVLCSCENHIRTLLIPRSLHAELYSLFEKECPPKAKSVTAVSIGIVGRADLG